MKQIMRIPTTMKKPENIKEIKIVGENKSIKLDERLTITNIEDIDAAVLAMGFVIKSITER